MASLSMKNRVPNGTAQAGLILDTFCFPIDLNFTPDRVGNVARVMGSTMQTFNFPCSGSAFSLKYYARTQRDLAIHSFPSGVLTTNPSFAANDRKKACGSSTTLRRAPPQDRLRKDPKTEAARSTVMRTHARLRCHRRAIRAHDYTVHP